MEKQKLMEVRYQVLNLVRTLFAPGQVVTAEQLIEEAEKVEAHLFKDYVSKEKAE